MKNVKSITDRELIVQKPLQNLQDLNFDEKKRALKKSKNKMTPSDDTGTQRSTLPVRIFPKEFCVEFLHSAYNQLMGVVRDALNRQRAQHNGETYYPLVHRVLHAVQQASPVLDRVGVGHLEQADLPLPTAADGQLQGQP